MTELPPPRSPLLDAYALDDGPADPELVSVARLAAALCGVPTATVNLLDSVAQHQVATHGFPGASSPRAEAMCDVTARLSEPVLVRDARQDDRFADNDWVTGARADVRFYASYQLRDSARDVVGTLCAFDSVPRELSPQQQEAMADLAAQASRLLAQRQESALLKDQLRTLDRSNAELSAFAGRVAHDLRNPLTGVLGFLQVAARREASPLVASCVAQATAAAVRLQEMLEGLLRFASAGIPAPPRETDLVALVGQVRGDVAHHVAAVGASVEVGPLGHVRTDPLLLGQVLQNLLSNAVKYGDPDRPVRVRVERLDAPGCVLTVSDNGRGIPAASRERVFELFARAPNAGEVAGTGIGLATCARSVEALGGSIALSPTRGGGLTVTVSLPDAPRDGQQAAGPAPG